VGAAIAGRAGVDVECELVTTMAQGREEEDEEDDARITQTLREARDKTVRLKREAKRARRDAERLPADELVKATDWVTDDEQQQSHRPYPQQSARDLRTPPRG
jgi:uncharacterized membrane protein